MDKACFPVSVQYRNLPFHGYTSFCLTQHTPKFCIKGKEDSEDGVYTSRTSQTSSIACEAFFFSLAREQISSEEKKKSV